MPPIVLPAGPGDYCDRLVGKTLRAQDAPMAAYRLASRVVQTAPGEWQIIVSAITVDHDGAEVRRDTLETSSEAEDRRDYLVMSLATELRARGHEVAGLDE